MGVGVSAHRLAGSVAALGAVGTISSVDLRRLHPDLMAATRASRDKQAIEQANLVALDREVKSALALAQGRGIVAVNVMRALSQYSAYVKQACESGAHAIVVGAGLPLDLPDLVREHPHVAIVPILSDARGIRVVLTKWMRRDRRPDAIVIEHPKFAGGHLGAASVAGLDDERFAFERVLDETHALFAELGIAPIPLIVAGGIGSAEDVRRWLGRGASAVQVGTAFAVTEEGDAHPNFKRVLAEARPEDIVEFMSVAGLPARAVRTPWLDRYLSLLDVLEAKRKPRKSCTLAWDCLARCGLRDGLPNTGQFCIDHHLAAALAGDVERGLFFRGAQPLPFGNAIRPVRELIALLLGQDALAAAPV